MTAIANARQTVPAPVRQPRRFGLLSVVDLVDGGEQHWMLGGLTADGEECSVPSFGTIGCAPSANKAMRSWYSDIDADPWMAYMYESCKTVGRIDESAAKLRTRFAASEQSAVELGFQANVLSGSQSDLGNFDSVSMAIGALEAYAAKVYGGQIILHLPVSVAEEGSSKGVFERSGGHLETVAGNLVSIGNYDPGVAATPSLYATGATVLYRSALAETGPVFDQATNDYFVLIERAYAALIDCFNATATAKVCGCA